MGLLGHFGPFILIIDIKRQCPVIYPLHFLRRGENSLLSDKNVYLQRHKTLLFCAHFISFFPYFFFFFFFFSIKTDKTQAHESWQAAVNAHQKYLRN